MAVIVERPGTALPETLRVTNGPRERRCRAFRPQRVVCLERRALLSVLAGPASQSPIRSTIAHAKEDQSPSSPVWTEVQNVSFPTVNGQAQLLDVYTPLSPAPAGGYPVMIAIHGGGWRSSDKSSFGLRTANAFTQDGYVVVAPNYVLSAPGSPTWPLNLEDVQAAVRWTRNNAATMGVNPNEIVGEGESAGANLAALLGVYSTQIAGNAAFSAVDAVVAVSTPANLTTLYHETHYAATAAAQFLGGSPRQVPGNYVAASPIDHVSPVDPADASNTRSTRPGDPREPVRGTTRRAHGGRGAKRAHSGQRGPWPRLSRALFEFGPQRP